MGGSEAIEEVKKGNTPLNGGQMRNCTQIHSILNAGGGQHGEACLPTGHNVGMLCIDGVSMERHRSGGYVDDSRLQLPGDSVHGGHHQQQPLGGGIGGGKGTGLQNAVHC